MKSASTRRVGVGLGLSVVAVVWLRLGTPGGVVALTAQESVSSKGGEGLTGEYEVVPNWPQPLSADWTWGKTDGIWAESADRVYVVQFGELPVLKSRPAMGRLPLRNATVEEGTGRFEKRLMVFNREGKLIESWDQHSKMFLSPHKLKISPYDPERHVWVVDGRSSNGKCAEQVFKFSRDGTLVMTVGEYGVAGNDQTHFGGPTDIFFLPNGDFLVADGNKNARVVRFNKDGKYVSEFGKRGSGPGEFLEVHTLAVDARGRIYAGDRGNRRIQVFDQGGKYLDHWPNIDDPNSILVTEDQHLWVGDGHTSRFLKYDLNGTLLYSWGAFGAEPGHFWGLHQFSVDSEGNLYTGEVFNGRAQKFRPKKGADPAKLVGQPFVPS